MPPRSRTTLPLIQPIVPVLRGVPFDDPAWVFEPKYDGFRGLLYVGPRHCWFRSKRGNTMTRFQELAEQVRDELRVRSAILDGEIVSLDEDGRQIFRRMLAGRGHVHYAAFDLLWLNGRDLRPQSLTRRKQRLARLIPTTTPTLSRLFSIERRGRDMLGAAQQLDLEGIVAKRKADPYNPETTTWYKIKNRAYTQAEGRWELFQKR
jgi:bifunctional non-homologous end joining protein LigD